MGKKQSRSEARQEAFKLIFQTYKNRDDVEFLVGQMLENKPESKQNLEYIRFVVNGVLEKEEELETLRQLVTESQQHTEIKDDRFFKRILLQQLGVIRMAASNPTTANQELIRRMSEIVDGQIPVDSLLNWEDLYQTIDYIYEGFYTRIKEKYGDLLNEKEIQLCCLLKANFSTKEISIVSGQGVRTVYQRKSVIRQKLGMEEKGDIVEFLS